MEVVEDYGRVTENCRCLSRNIQHSNGDVVVVFDWSNWTMAIGGWLREIGLKCSETVTGSIR